MSQQEYISREAVCAALGCENATKYGNKTPEQRDRSYSTLMLYEIADAIDDVPAADVAPVVRCKDCRFYAIKQSSLCDMHNTAVNAEDYCSYGVKNDGGEHHAD